MTLLLNAFAAVGCEQLARNVYEPAQLPAEVEFIMSALEAARGPSIDRRAVSRCGHKVLGHLRLFSDAKTAAPWEIYSRDATPRAMGFITRHRLPLGYGGTVKLSGPQGEELAIECTVRRCRETVHGWFEGSLSFNRDQTAFMSDEHAARHDAHQETIFRDFRRIGK